MSPAPRVPPEARPRRLAFIVSAGIALGLLATAPAVAQTAQTSYRTFRPDGPGPYPAVVFVSGCDGLTPSISPTLYERRAEHLRGQGHLVVFADYLGRRALKTCAGPITHEDVARDVVAAATWLRAQPAVDPSRITAMGWSYGGRGVLTALGQFADKQLVFSRAVVYYPDCRALDGWKATLPVLMLLGGDDDMTPARLCQEAAKRAAVPAAVKVVVYPGARHGFDVPELPAQLRYGFATIGYHPEAAAAARREVEQFLRPGR